MPTPDFEEWLIRQDIPIEDTTTVDKYISRLEEDFGIHGGSLRVAENIYTIRYKGLEEYGIRPFKRHYFRAGEPFVETRYGVSRKPGAWGREAAYRFGASRAEEAGQFDIAERLRRRVEES